jgi:hypothetical protein
MANSAERAEPSLEECGRAADFGCDRFAKLIRSSAPVQEPA